MSSAVMSLPQRAVRLYGSAAQLIDRLQPLFALAIRVYVARVFFLSGLTKLHDWNITLALFRNEYHVPVLPPAVAAVLGTSAELGLPVLLFFGFGTRFAAVALFVVQHRRRDVLSGLVGGGAQGSRAVGGAAAGDGDLRTRDVFAGPPLPRTMELLIK